jgi:hypothetical protein
MTRKTPRRRTPGRRAAAVLFVAAAAAVVVATLTAVAGSASRTPTPKTPQAIARYLQKTVGRHMTWPARAALAMVANGTHQFGSNIAQAQATASPGARSGLSRVGKGHYLSGPGLTNVRVNNPAEDGHFIDQTTQSEPMVAASGPHVVVGFNDSATTGLFLTAASNLTGYSYSTNGGQTFTDAGALQNAPGFINFGDPWLASARDGSFYFSNLMLDGTTGNLDVGVSRSTDGGKTFPAPTNIAPTNDLFYSGDKDAMAVGPDPTNRAQDDVYVSWDDQFADQSGNLYDGLPVAHSTDGGKTWQVTYADKFLFDFNSCSFVQYIGATPAVAWNGTVYVAAEKFSVDDPDCTGTAPFVATEWIFKSTDGGQTWNAGKQLATVTEIPNGAIDLGPGMLMRDIEFPSLAVTPPGNVYVAWDDAQSGRSHIRLAYSTNSGTAWKLTWATSSPGDQVQPALSADKSGLHLLYYQKNPDDTLDAVVANSPNATTSFSQTRVTSTSFPGVFTAPQFDPIIAPAYMGDYVGNVSYGGHQYFAWGDNRNTVTNFLWPHGRNDPNVYFAKTP